VNSSLARPEAGSRAIRLVVLLGVASLIALAAAPSALAGTLGSTPPFNAAAQVTVEVRKGSRRAARRAGSAKRGRNTLTLRLPRNARKGRSVLTLTGVSGEQRATDTIAIVIR